MPSKEPTRKAPIFDERRSVVQVMPSPWPKVWRTAVDLFNAAFPWPFLIVALVRLPFAKAADPNASGLWGDMRWIVGVQIFVLATLVDGSFGDPASSAGDIPRLAYGAALLVVLGTTIAMLWRSRLFPALYGVQWIAVVAAAVVDYAMFLPAGTLALDNPIKYAEFEFKVQLLASTIAAIAGLWLLVTSRQSKNTFVR